MATKFFKVETIQSGKGLMKKDGSMKKYEYGGNKTDPAETFSSRKTKTVSVSPDKNYKTIVKQKISPSELSTKVSNRRTIKGVVTGAPKVVNSAPMKKKGGAIKSKKK